MKSEGKKSKREILRYVIRHYNQVRESCDQMILSRMKTERQNEQSLEWFAALMQGRDPDAWADAVRETSRHTEELIMILDFALVMYRNMAREEAAKSGDFRSWRQFDSLYSKYFSTHGGTVWEIGYKYGVSKSVVYEDIDIAENRLIAMILGDMGEDGPIF